VYTIETICEYRGTIKFHLHPQGFRQKKSIDIYVHTQRALSGYQLFINSCSDRKSESKSKCVVPPQIKEICLIVAKDRLQKFLPSDITHSHRTKEMDCIILRGFRSIHFLPRMELYCHAPNLPGAVRYGALTKLYSGILQQNRLFYSTELLFKTPLIWVMPMRSNWLISDFNFRFGTEWTWPHIRVSHWSVWDPSLQRRHPITYWMKTPLVPKNKAKDKRSELHVKSIVSLMSLTTHSYWLDAVPAGRLKPAQIIRDLSLKSLVSWGKRQQRRIYLFPVENNTTRYSRCIRSQKLHSH
jgi:hypothetical protein